ncbi:hypothetical protein F5I97DRAFT_1843302 [Phlebopus sp. FC_14]|nr:hypothetical protein F5I97DRAFT_1843302 [Phlebopus sp. FC_14]
MSGLRTFFKKWAKEFKQGGWNKLVEGLATAQSGSRAWPNRTKDRAIGARLDYGEIFVGEDGQRYRNIVFQPNKDAEDRTVAAKAAQNSHQALAKIRVSVDNPPSADVMVDELDKLI